VTSTHENKIQSAEAAALDLTNSNDEKIREIGKSNIDKWLHVLLDEESPRRSTEGAAQSSDSPDSSQPPLSPALSDLSMAALRGSVELDEGRDDISLYYHFSQRNFSAETVLTSFPCLCAWICLFNN
jgi:hypothetical protein